MFNFFKAPNLCFVLEKSKIYFEHKTNKSDDRIEGISTTRKKRQVNAKCYRILIDPGTENQIKIPEILCPDKTI